MTQNIRDVTGRNRSVQDMLRDIERAGLPSEGRSPDNGGSGSGGGNMFEKRVEALEKRTDRIEGKLDTLIERTSRMEGEVHRLPGYPGLFAMCSVLVGLVGVIVKFF